VSLFVLDEHLDEGLVRDQLLRWTTARYVHDIRPGEVVKDDRILSILPTLRTPTFVTSDDFFWKRTHCNSRYCIVFVALRGRNHSRVPDLLRRLLRLPEFRSRAARMGKVVHLGEDHVRWWQLGDEREHSLHWGRPSRRTGR
jgi:hypothetical protein